MTTAPDLPQALPGGDDTLAAELAIEQAHVDRVYTELDKASQRARLVAAEGMARGRTERTGEARLEEVAGLFERDALVFHAARRQHALDTQYEGLVFGRLDLDHPIAGGEGDGQAEREVRYIGRLGVRDDDYEPLVIDWRAPAAAPFYRATPVEPMGVLRRRVLRCRGPVVVGAEDDLMVPDPPDGLVVLGDGALMAALTRSRGARMRDIVATIQRHQDEAIRAPGRGVTEITGGPGTGKTVVALHRAAYLLYADRRRYESGGILVVGPSAAYTAYIERVLPSLGEDSVALRALGDVVDAMSTDRHDDPAAAAVKGSLRMREVLARAARGLPDGVPTELRTFVAGYAVRLDSAVLQRVRAHVLRQHPHNLAVDAARNTLAETALRSVGHPEREEFLGRFADHLDVEAFLAAWWPQVDPREVLLWLADRERLDVCAAGLLSREETDAVHRSLLTALETGTWSIADVALVDELSVRLGPVQEQPAEERGFYEIENLDELLEGATGGALRPELVEPAYETTPHDPRERLLAGRIERTPDYAHVLVDEAQDLSPMQWRMLGRRGRHASWTVVGDAAQSAWPDPAESLTARADAWGGQEHRLFHMGTNYRNAREIFDYAAAVVRTEVPDADIPEAVRETGIPPREGSLGELAVDAVAAEVARLGEEVDGTIAVITPRRYAAALAELDGSAQGRVRVLDPLSTKGLEWDATVVVDPDEIVRESPGGIRTLYVVLTRAAHRMSVLRSQ
ncbi:MAG: UvrD-helicase domain-containing protein [Candidatus Phosphoribacter baldrii]